MIPPFTKEGYLPSGIHETDLDELRQRFAYTIWRKELFENLIRLMNDLKSIGCTAIYFDGSFTTTTRIPKDIDVCWEDLGIDYDMAEAVMPILFDFDNNRENQQRQYKCDIFPAHYFESGKGVYFIDFFQLIKYTDDPKGIIKINIH